MGGFKVRMGPVARRKPVNVSVHRGGRGNNAIGRAAVTTMVRNAKISAPVITVLPVILLTVCFLVSFYYYLFFFLIRYFELCMALVWFCLAPNVGTCTCAAGFTGPLCKDKCQTGYYGADCQEVCQCEDDHNLGCDPITGKCICQPEWKGKVAFFPNNCFVVFVFISKLLTIILKWSCAKYSQHAN